MAIIRYFDVKMQVDKSCYLEICDVGGPRGLHHHVRQSMTYMMPRPYMTWRQLSPLIRHKIFCPRHTQHLRSRDKYFDRWQVTRPIWRMIGDSWCQVMNHLLMYNLKKLAWFYYTTEAFIVVHFPFYRCDVSHAHAKTFMGSFLTYNFFFCGAKRKVI